MSELEYIAARIALAAFARASGAEAPQAWELAGDVMAANRGVPVDRSLVPQMLAEIEDAVVSSTPTPPKPEEPNV